MNTLDANPDPENRGFKEELEDAKYSFKEFGFYEWRAKIIWAYLTLLWLCLLDEGTDVYGAYKHFW